MKPSQHLAGSTVAAGALYAATGSPTAAASCLLSGVFIDLDHLVDFFLLAGERFSPRAFSEWCRRSAQAKFLLLLHSYELFALLVGWASLGADPVVWGAAAGVGVHLVMDQVGNRGIVPGFRLSGGFYFLVWRLLVGFRRERLLRPA